VRPVPFVWGAVAFAVLVAAGCGSPTGSSDVADRSDVATVGSESSTTSDDGIVVVDATSLPPMEVVAALGYPRDLLDRGRVNVRISRDGDTPFLVSQKQLVADHFEPAAPEARRSELPPNGQVVALQTEFGEVVDCDSTSPVQAEMSLVFTYGDDPTVKRTSVPFTDATVLDQIRTRECTVRRIVDENDIELRDPQVDGETMRVDLVVDRREGDSRLGFDSIKGTVIFGASTVFEPGDRERILDPDEDSATIPLELVVNRCDSHAVAETTRKFGIDLYVSVDGAESQRVDVPIDSIVRDLESMLDTCKDRTGQ
jgi:hypothetical protein